MGHSFVFDCLAKANGAAGLGREAPGGIGGNAPMAIRAVWCQRAVNGDQPHLTGSDGPIWMTGLARLSARVVIRPRKMTIRLKNRPDLRGAAQKAVTSWCQTLVTCGRTLCLHYELREIHDFDSKSCSSWIHSSQIAPQILASGWSNKALSTWTNLVRLFRSGSI